MEDYMPFAWDKANGCRGLSALRSLIHFAAWLWLLSNEDYNHFGGFKGLSDYQFYGKEKLIDICERFNWDHFQWDDGVRSNSEY